MYKVYKQILSLMCGYILCLTIHFYVHNNYIQTDKNTTFEIGEHQSRRKNMLNSYDLVTLATELKNVYTTSNDITWQQNVAKRSLTQLDALVHFQGNDLRNT